MSGGPIGESDLQAYVDGRLPPAQAAALEAWLAERPDDAARIAAMRQNREILKAAYEPLADEPEAGGPGERMDLEGERRHGGRRVGAPPAGVEGQGHGPWYGSTERLGRRSPFA